MNDSEHICFEAIQFAQISEKGLSDVSILTIGEAQGHGVMVDEKTIEDFMRLSLGKTIPAYLTHAGAIDKDGRPADRLGKEIGMFSGFYRDGNKVRAKNFQFLEAFKQAEPKTHATLVEMARNFADKLGISPVLRHVKSWVTRDGEVPADGKTVPAGALNEMPSMRLRDLLSCDFVQKPAANLGLFEAKIDDATSNKTQLMSDSILLSKHNEELSALSTQHKDAISALETKHKEAVSALEAKANEAIAQLAKKSEEAAGLTAALAAKTLEAEEAAKYDMRKAGGEALQVALDSRGPKIPAPAASDSGKWEQYAALCTPVTDEKSGLIISHVETPAAKAFKDKYLSRK